METRGKAALRSERRESANKRKRTLPLIWLKDIHNHLLSQTASSKETFHAHGLPKRLFRSNLRNMRILQIFRILLLLSLCLVFESLTGAQSEKNPSQIVITHVTVINPGTSSVQP